MTDIPEERQLVLLRKVSEFSGAAMMDWEGEARRLSQEVLTGDLSLSPEELQHEADLILFLYDGLVYVNKTQHSAHIPAFSELAMEIYCHNDSCFEEIAALRVLHSDEGREDLVAYFADGTNLDKLTKEQFDEAVSEMVMDQVDYENTTFAYYRGWDQLFHFVATVLAQNNRPYIIDFETLPLYEDRYASMHFNYEVVANDAQNVLFPDFQIQGLDGWITTMDHEAYSAKIMIVPAKEKPPALIPEFAGHLIR